MKRPPVKNPRHKVGEPARCKVCNRPIIGPKVYCSDACKQKAYRERNQQLPGPPPERTDVQDDDGLW